MHHTAAAALFDVSDLDSATKQRMPTIMDFNFLPDMGRMSANLSLAGATIYLPVPMAAGTARR
jgi:hypothetical protein